METNIDGLRRSGLNMVILELLHIGRGPEISPSNGGPVNGQSTGDIIFNNNICDPMV